MRIFAPTDPRQRESETEYMPLLRSLANRAACVAINMALLTEPSPSPPPHFPCVKDKRKVHRWGEQSKTL